MKKYPLLWFYILAFALAWLGWIPLALESRGSIRSHPAFLALPLLPAVAPMVAAVIVAQVTGGKAGMGALLKGLVHWRVDVAWYAVAIFAPLVLQLAGMFVTALFHFSDTFYPTYGSAMELFILAFVTALISNPWEEVGWRGFALPRLQKRSTALVATLIVGVLWALWHLPIFFWTSNPMSEYPFLPWFIGVVALAFIYTWLYNSTKGSILLAAIFHVSLNTFGAVMMGVVSITAFSIVCCIVAVALVIFGGPANLSRQEKVVAE